MNLVRRRRTGREPSAEPPAPEWLLNLRESTPARVLVGRAGAAYPTRTHLTLQADHAFARDAVHAELDLARDFGEELLKSIGLFEVHTEASSRTEHLLRPDKGRRLSAGAKEEIASRVPRGAELQLAVGDGLSATAVGAHAPTLLPMLLEEAGRAGLRVGRPFFVRYCRVGVLNDIGELLDPEVVVLLVGERPGMSTAESLSAYFAYRPRAGCTDADRNLISNIHARGVIYRDAVRRILGLVQQMRRRRLSGVAVKEEPPTALPDESGGPPRLSETAS